jgi:hypothetical protein
MSLIGSPALPYSSAELDKIVSVANTILSQAGVELSVKTSGSQPTSFANYFDVTSIDSFSGTVDNVIKDYETPNIDVFLAHSIDDGALTGDTIYQGAHTRLNFADPGIVIAAFPSSKNTPLLPKYDATQLGRTLSHEFLHYAMKEDDGAHSTKQWNVFSGGEHQYTYKRDIDDAPGTDPTTGRPNSQLQRLLNVALSTTLPDQ